MAQYDDTMRGETQQSQLYSQQLLFRNFQLMRWTQVLKLTTNMTDIEVWKYTISLYYMQQCASVGMRNWEWHDMFTFHC